MKNSCLIVGAGYMGFEYAKILQSMGVGFDVVCRSEETADSFYKKVGVMPSHGGIESYLGQGVDHIGAAIVAVNVSSLYSTTDKLIDSGIRKILVEKPGSLFPDDLASLKLKADKMEASVFIGYNRRFYESVSAARKIIEEDGGVRSFTFEFTEWSHKIEPLKKEGEEKARWFLSNSSHVADLAFFLGGEPVRLDCNVSGGLDWHPAGSAFSGSGISDRGAVFSYLADWKSAGNWFVEILTKNRRLIFNPLEQLKIKERGKTEVIQVELISQQERNFKPGLYQMTEQFLEGDFDGFCTLEDQIKAFEYYLRMANYS